MIDYTIRSNMINFCPQTADLMINFAADKIKEL